MTILLYIQPPSHRYYQWFLLGKVCRWCCTWWHCGCSCSSICPTSTWIRCWWCCSRELCHSVALLHRDCRPRIAVCYPTECWSGGPVCNDKSCASNWRSYCWVCHGHHIWGLPSFPSQWMSVVLLFDELMCYVQLVVLSCIHLTFLMQ